MFGTILFSSISHDCTVCDKASARTFSRFSFMVNLEVVVLNNERPGHKTLVVVVHSGQKGVMVCEDLNRLDT